VLLFERVVRRMPWLVVLVKVLLVRMLLKLFAIYMPSPALLDPMLLVRMLLLEPDSNRIPDRLVLVPMLLVRVLLELTLRVMP